jgi:hypothetical protein
MASDLYWQPKNPALQGQAFSLPFLRWIQKVSAAINRDAPFVREASPVVMADASILTSPTTPVTILPAGGPNTIIVPLQMIAVVDTRGGAYTNIDAAAYGWVRYGSGAGVSNYLADDATLTPARAYFSGVFGTASQKFVPFRVWEDTVETNQWGNLANFWLESDSVNQPLEWVVDNGGSGDFTGGGSNTMTWLVQYLTLTV